MKVLMINKFLYPKGGAETYTLKLGKYLQEQGHEVQYFGMEHPSRTVGNRVDAYTSYMDFHSESMLAKLSYSFKTVYSSEARKKIRQVLEDFQPEVCHLNNFNYQLTPSIILEIRKWEKETGHKCKVLYTAHDPQLVCPNHMCLNPNTHQVCEKCFGGRHINCTLGKCVHGSVAKSLFGTMEGYLWKWLGVYRKLDTIICPSNFMKTKLDTDPVLAGKTVVLHNFVDPVEKKQVQKKDYVLYFGRYSEEKGLETLVKAVKGLPEINFIFAGSGPSEHVLENVPNLKNVGFQTGEALEMLIREARFSIIPSECYENCPFSVLESQMYGTPVLGANIGGIPELINEGKTGELFESGNEEELRGKIQQLWQDWEKLEKYSENCNHAKHMFVEEYVNKMMQYYQ